MRPLRWPPLDMKIHPRCFYIFSTKGCSPVPERSPLVSAITRRPSLTAHHKQRAACDGDESHGLARRCHTMSYPRASASCTVRCNWILQGNGANRCVRTYSGSALQILPACPSVRTYAANHRKTPTYSDAPAPRSRKNPRTRRPAALVTLLQYSRLYLPWLAITGIAEAAGL